MADDDGDKSEEPTGKRLTDARNEGNLAQSTEAKALASLLAALVVVGLMAPGMATDVQRLLYRYIEQPHVLEVTPDSIRGLLLDVVLGLGLVLAMPLAVVLVFGLAAPIIQYKGFLWVPKKVMPDLTKMSPLQGIKRVVSAAQLVEFIKAMVKITMLGTVLMLMFWSDLKEFENLPQLDLVIILQYVHDRTYQLIFITVLMMTVLTFADYLFVHWRWKEKLKMSKQEVKDEHKQQEGDPHIKARLRSLRMSRARKRMMAAVPAADVVVTNPTHFAVALKYDQDSMSAPVLVAKGVDLVAKRIREIANENDVPVVENPPLARALYATVELDQEVPPEHYKAVAEIIGYVMRLKGKLAN
ncbi:flagellar biosynthesis protein FlhB [Magnetospirillum sp. UT-4]|uniref:flagellar biosynthesis protein FlhB n=1 Tax=Magnetospirillum sp. UT-4 TaxID=2681467 RepID=UPI001381C409|nr:flagellar biosynthesis protein FlhB [Magnetospirillum sp. UT-4]CAA7612799.1 Flagellar export pore protein [Magnetospirillum sp. UT-4]